MSLSFIHDDFLLASPAARRLYHEHAASQPILDFHNHLSPEDIATDRRFHDLYEMWLEGDHYKWRAMRWNGEPEELITGDAPHYEKFLAFARTVPNTLRNPLYHWTHLELKRYFGIDTLLSVDTAEAIWNEANDQLASRPELTAQGTIRGARVKALCTTDDPAASTTHHEAVNDDPAAGFKAYPTFRPDAGFTIGDPVAFNAWCDELAAAADTHIADLTDFESALRARHDHFHALGSRLSDHGMEQCFADFPTTAEAATLFARARSGATVSPADAARFSAHLMLFVGRINAERGWTQQMHLGAIRNTRPALFRQHGPDLGTDSISDAPQARALATYLGRLDEDGLLPKMVLYNLNPAANYTIATMAANFQDGSVPGKIQFGSGWWFLDQKEGMEWQLNALSNCGLLSRFIGMLTDSRSFTSFARHEYFRRTLCNLLGEDIEDGLLPRDFNQVGSLVENICFNNARDYLDLELPAS